ncbi:MAG TPA: alkaline phosphatase family protein [Acidimicrobiales bacterium]|nr:alkaline phosphatase family protein [Acidimicrobiales bacterium]
MSGPRITRRRFLGVTGAAVAFPGALLDRALSVEPAGSSLKDVKHIVMLMQENRSFDHYFGTMSGVRGFADRTSYRSFRGGPRTDPATVWDQTTVDKGQPLLAVGGDSYLRPFELVSEPPTADGQTLNDITHDWGPQHLAWNDGTMDRFVVQHLLNDGRAALQYSSGPAGVPQPGPSTAPIGIETMGYYRPGDSLEFYRAVASAFTICDRYHCSVMGPTDPNRLMWMSGSLGAHSGDVGGPVLTTYVSNREQMLGTLDWPTVPELLTEHGVSWKVYQDPTSNALFNVLNYFKSYAAPANPTQAHNAALGLAPVYPAGFATDVVAGTLPQVSWIMPPAANCEHPATPPEYGEYLVSQILQTLLLNPEVWASTVFLVLYDENGGFFDHVAPPTPGPTVTTLAGLPPAAFAGGQLDGEYVTTPDPTNAAGGPPGDWGNVLGPAGLGFRVPALVISPFSAGGWVCRDTFDHVSTHKLIESVFLTPGALAGGGGLHVSPWRYSTVGDLTSALPTLARPVRTVPALPATTMGDPTVVEQNVLLGFAGTADYGPAYPVPPANGPVPAQDDPGPGRTTG